MMRIALSTHSKSSAGDGFVRPVLQRKCACGGSDHAECDECRKKKEGTMQRTPAESSAAGPVPALVHDVLRSSGEPLDAGTRALLEPRFTADFSHLPVHSVAAGAGSGPLTIGRADDPAEHEAERIADRVAVGTVPPASSAMPSTDFGRVRIHADARAADSARAVNALAYTVGRDIVFGAGQYAPGTAQGRRLLAHELTHVLQQRGANPHALQRQEPKESPTIPIPVFDELDPTVIVPDIPAIPEFLRGQEVKLSTVKKALDVLAGKKGGGAKPDCKPAIGFERAGMGEFKGLCCRGPFRSKENCCEPRNIALLDNRCCIGTEVVLDGHCVTLPVVLKPLPGGKPQGPVGGGPVQTPTPAPTAQPKPVPPSVVIHFERDKPAAGSAVASSMTGAGPAALAGLVAQLQADPELRVQLVGRASPEGTPEYNRDLAARRAEAVADALVGAGISAARITDPTTSDLRVECGNVRPGVVSCGEAGSTGPADRQVLARFSRATAP
jgi:hypothetical protein